MKLGKIPAIGSKRTVVRFAWFPVQICLEGKDGGDVVWLEKFIAHEEYYCDVYCAPRWHIMHTEHVS